MQNKENKTVVRVETTYWHDEKGAYFKKSLKFLKRKSHGFNVLLDGCQNGGSDEVGRILNINDVKDGIYEVAVVNVSRDIESGYVDDWDLELVKFTE
jgi:hypothetical protein